MPVSASYQQAKTGVERLVERFARNLDAYRGRLAARKP